MNDKQLRSSILKETMANAGHLAGLTCRIVDLVPCDKLEEAESIAREMIERYAYQNYLYVMHGHLQPAKLSLGRTVVLDFEKAKRMHVI